MKRPEWVRYRLVSTDGVRLSFRVPRGTPMVLEQAGWEITSEVLNRSVPPAPPPEKP